MLAAFSLTLIQSIQLDHPSDIESLGTSAYIGFASSPRDLGKVPEPRRKFPTTSYTNKSTTQDHLHFSSNDQSPSIPTTDLSITPTKMPSRSNPNTPTSHKPKTAHALRSKRQNTQRLTQNAKNAVVLRTSQAIRKAAPLSKKKARKLEKRIGYKRKRALQEVLDAGEVEMTDVKEEGGKRRGGGEAMDVDIDVGGMD